MNGFGIIVLLFIGFVIFKMVRAQKNADGSLHRMPSVKRKKPRKPHSAPPPEEASWREFARGMGFFYHSDGPAVTGRRGSGPFRMTKHTKGPVRTQVRMTLTPPLPYRLVVTPHRLPPSVDSVETDDLAFHRDYNVGSRSPVLARAALGGRARAWFMALGDAEASATGSTLTVSVPGLEKDLDRLRALVELAGELLSGIQSA